MQPKSLLSLLVLAVTTVMSSALLGSDWSVLVGKIGEDVKNQIKEARPDLNAIDIVGEDDMLTMDFREDRVRVFVDEDNKCVRTPTVG
mmetsp:Transcript_31310/g.31596  ORF Transcript_31310/g.31596 Transcript_31310/m.31596 type:complete len:88 (-) Transcript_31310:380-643(-)